MNAADLPQASSPALRWDQVRGGLVARSFWYCFVGVLALMSWNGFWRLGETVVRDCDEARYGVAASEMLHAHSLLVTTYGGATEFWNLKPPLGYWLLDLSYLLVGETPFGLRLPAAICALVVTALTMLMARRIAGSRAAIIAGLALATSFGFLAHHGARSGELDAPLTLLLFLFLALAPRLFDSLWARLAAGLLLALAFLLKSFAILPFVAAVAAYYLITRGAASWRVWPLPLGIVVVTATAWAMARTVAEGSTEFVRRMFVEDLLLRSTTAIDPDAGSGAWDYLGALFDRLAPWPLIVLLAWYLSRRFARERLSGDFAVLLWCYTLIPLALFTLARTHHSHYIIPTYPAWAILAAVGTLEVLTAARRIGWAGRAATLIAVCIVACEVRLIAHIAIHDAMPRSQAFLASLHTQTGREPQVFRTTFTPSYSERFFLQVVDGFRLEEATTDDGKLRASDLVLVKKPADGWAPAPPFVALAQNEDYAFVKLQQPAVFRE